MLKKLQVIFSILAGLALIVFIIAVCTNVNVPTIPTWVAPVVWSSLGLIAVCCLAIVITLILELIEREPKEEDELVEEPFTDETVEELAAVGAVSEIHAGEGIEEPAAHFEMEAEPFEAHSEQFEMEEMPDLEDE